MALQTKFAVTARLIRCTELLKFFAAGLPQANTPSAVAMIFFVPEAAISTIAMIRVRLAGRQGHAKEAKYEGRGLFSWSGFNVLRGDVPSLPVTPAPAIGCISNDGMDVLAGNQP
ncbi:MAG: hypothetical protein WDM89_20355 [Rhizomicrobium sp.]